MPWERFEKGQVLFCLNSAVEEFDPSFQLDVRFEDEREPEVTAGTVARGREFKKGTDTIRINISMNIDISMRFTAKVALADTHARLPKRAGIE